MNNTELKKEIITNFNLVKYDFMGYHLNKRPSYHHIIKKCNGGKTNFENGAVISSLNHQYLHIIEYHEYYMYKFINELFKTMHKRGEILESDYRLISDVLHEFEKKHSEDTNSKGKLLIRRELLDRDY